MDTLDFSTVDFSLWFEMENISLLPEGSSFGERIKKAWNKFRSQSPLQLFTWVVILFIFVFYCIPKSKRSVYLLPIYPFMAVLIAEYLLALVQRGAKVFKISAYIFASLALLLTITFAVVRLGLIPDSVWGTGKHAMENVGFMNALENVDLSFSKWLLVALPPIAGVCMLIALAKKADSRSLLYGIAGCILCLFVSLDGVYQPTVLSTKSDKRLAEEVNTYVQDGVMYSYTTRLIRFYCTNYYLNDRMRNFTPGLSGTGYVMLSERTKEDFLKEYSDKYQLEEIYLTPYRSCDLRDKVLIYKFSENESDRID